jgi:nitrogen fixation protein NifU and related proteins
MYSSVAQEHFHNPRRVGPLPGATHQGTAGVPGAGPYVVLWLRVGEDGAEAVVKAAAYRTFGCPAAIASASALCELAEGKGVADALSITEADLTEALGGLPEGKDHCPRLAVEALRACLDGVPAG